MNTRLPTPDPESMTDAQSAAFERISQRGGFAGPYPALLRWPELATAVSAVGEIVRGHSPLDQRLVELAILVTAHHWKAQFPWWAHSRLARRAGLDRAVIDDVRVGRVPADLDHDARAVYELAVSVLATGEIPDDVYQRSIEQLGEAVTVAVTATVGYYGLVCAMVNLDRQPVPEGVEPPFGST